MRLGRAGQCRVGSGGAGTVAGTRGAARGFQKPLFEAGGGKGGGGGWLDAFIWREVPPSGELLFRAPPAAILGWVARAFIFPGEVGVAEG